MYLKALVFILLFPFILFAQEGELDIYGIERIYDTTTNEGKQRIKDYLNWRINKKGDELSIEEAELIFSPKNQEQFKSLMLSVENFENNNFMSVNEIRNLLKESKYRGYVEENRFERENKKTNYVFQHDTNNNQNQFNEVTILIIIILVLISLYLFYRLSRKK